MGKPAYQRIREQRAKEEAGMVREGSADGYPTARFDASRRAWFHLNGAGERVYHAAPAGREYDEEGRVKPLDEETES